LGTANRSEYLVGWFVKDGIDDLPFSPLIGLYKTQVRQLSEFLGLPFKIRNRLASPDMVKGITDEFALGISYSVSVIPPSISYSMASTAVCRMNR